MADVEFEIEDENVDVSDVAVTEDDEKESGAEQAGSASQQDVPPPPAPADTPQPVFDSPKPAEGAAPVTPPPPPPQDFEKLVSEQTKPLQEKLDQQAKLQALNDKKVEIARRIRAADQIIEEAWEHSEQHKAMSAMGDRVAAQLEGQKLIEEEQAIKNPPPPEQTQQPPPDPANPWADPAAQKMVSEWQAVNTWFGAPGMEEQTKETNWYSAQLLNAGWSASDPRTYREVERHLKAKFSNSNENKDVGGGVTAEPPVFDSNSQGNPATPTGGSKPSKVRISKGSVDMMNKMFKGKKPPSATYLAELARIEKRNEQERRDRR